MISKLSQVARSVCATQAAQSVQWHTHEAFLCFLAGEEVRLQRNALVVLALPQGTEPVRAIAPGTVHLVNRNQYVSSQCWLQDTSEPEEAGNLAHAQGGARLSRCTVMDPPVP